MYRGLVMEVFSMKPPPEEGQKERTMDWRRRAGLRDAVAAYVYYNFGTLQCVDSHHDEPFDLTMRRSSTSIAKGDHRTR